MKMDKDQEQKLDQFLKSQRLDPPEPKLSEEARIRSAIEADEAPKKSPWLEWRWWVPALGMAAAVLVVVFFSARLARLNDPSFEKETARVEARDIVVSAYEELGSWGETNGEALIGEEYLLLAEALTEQ